MQKSKLQSKMQKLMFPLWPVSIILFVWIIFSYPYFFQHRVPFPSTYAVNFFPPWSAYHIYDGPIKNNAMPDVITQIYPWRYFTIQSLKQGQIPLWNPYNFSGTPHLANYQSTVLSPFNILFFIFPFIDAWSLLILLQPLLAGIFSYVYCRSLQISKTGSVIASIAFMFCGFMTTWMDYGTLGYAILFLPLALFAIEKFVSTNKFIYLVLLSITIPLSFFSGHFQISLYFLLFIALYTCYTYIQTRDTRQVVYVFLYILFGLLLAMPQIFPSLEFYKQSLRSNLFQKVEAIPVTYLPTLLVPDFFGNPVTRNDWFGHYAEWNGYIGLLPFILAIYALLRKKHSLTIFFGTMSLVVFFLAFSTPLLSFMINLHIPVLSTSAASRSIVLFSFIFSILSGIGFDLLITDLQKRKVRYILLLLGSFFLIFIFLWILVMGRFLPFDKIAIAKQNILLPSLVFVCLSLVFLWAAFFCTKILKNTKKNTIFLSIAIICILITAFDLLRFATKWQSFDPRSFVFPQAKVLSGFEAKKVYERFYGDDGAQFSVYNQLPSIEGYDPLYIRRYGEFIASLQGTLSESPRSVVTFPKQAVYSPTALSLLNVRYILQKNSDNGMAWSFPFSDYPINQLPQIYNDGYYSLYKNNLALQHAFFAQRYSVETNPQKIINVLLKKNSHVDTNLVLEKDPHISQGNVVGSADITSYTPNEMTLRTRVNKDALLFTSEIFYPGWKAYVDGKETSIYRTDFTFRSIVVPGGFHTVSFVYQPMSFILGCWLCMFGVIGIVTLPLIRKKKLIQ